NCAATASSVSKRAKPVRRSKARPTDDLPAPIIPMRTIDLAGLTAKYLINTWLQPGAFASNPKVNRLNGLPHAQRLVTALEAALIEVVARKLQVPSANAQEISGRRFSFWNLIN